MIAGTELDLILEADTGIDLAVSCDRCEALCCRLTVVLSPTDRVPAHYTAHDERGLHVMAHGEDGWCVAIDPLRMCCSIYEQRPAICRKFAMGGPYCRDIRAAGVTFEEADGIEIPTA